MLIKILPFSIEFKLIGIITIELKDVFNFYIFEVL